MDARFHRPCRGGIVLNSGPVVALADSLHHRLISVVPPAPVLSTICSLSRGLLSKLDGESTGRSSRHLSCNAFPSHITCWRPCFNLLPPIPLQKTRHTFPFPKVILFIQRFLGSLLKNLQTTLGKPQRRKRNMLIERSGKTIQAPQERHVRLIAGTCRSYGAGALFNAKIYKHVAPMALNEVFQQAVSGVQNDDLRDD